MSFKQPPELYKLQSDALGASLVDNPYLPPSLIPSKNKVLNTNKAYVTGAVNELLQTIANIKKLAQMSLDQQQAVLGDFMANPNFISDLQKIDTSVLKAIVKLAKEIDGDSNDPPAISAIAPSIKEAILKLNATMTQPESAYEIWLALGNTGTKEDFLNSLKGEKGADGKASTSVAPGGRLGQILVKLSDTDHDIGWKNAGKTEAEQPPAEMLDDPFIAEYKRFELPAGTHLIECYGAQGGGGLGGYSSGVIILANPLVIYAYLGESGVGITRPTWNGGGRYTDGADQAIAGYVGGATDIRLIPGDWDNVESLRSRIMVAGGGGGAAGFISGMEGCNAIDINGKPTGQPNHYSGVVFTDCEMQTGVHKGHGLVRITLNCPYQLYLL